MKLHVASNECMPVYNLSLPLFTQGESQTWGMILKGQLVLPASRKLVVRLFL